MLSRRRGPARPESGKAPGQGRDAPAQRLTWREQRWERRRRRRVAEEVFGWVLVPVILVGGYWLLTAILAALGTSPGAIIDGVQSVIGAAR